MKERGIIFNAESVRAILAGTKTQSRRVIKPQPPDEWMEWLIRNNGGSNHYYRDGEPTMHLNTSRDITERGECPYGKPGDRLYCKETWLVNAFGETLYKADWARGGHMEGYECGGYGWKSPIFMPRWASRITLEVTEVRVERLQSISADDARAEGCNGLTPWMAPELCDHDLDARCHFEATWDSINARRGFSWESNPYVWAITLKRVQP